LTINENQFVEGYFDASKDIYKTVMWVIKDKSITEDILHDTFEKGFNNRHMLKDQGKLKPWLKKIALNLAYDYLKINNNNISIDDIIEIKCLQEKNSIEKKLLDNEMKSELYTALNNINPKHALILYCRYFLNMTYEDIAKEFCVNTNTIKSKLSRAKKKLKEQFLKLFPYAERRSKYEV
jgi:RNA polymerase sigma-70 factor (ECF subfamily)